MIKKCILNLLKHPVLAPHFLRIALKLHNLSYQLASTLSSSLEPDKLHPKHRLMKYHDWFAQKLEKDWDVLDIGCGNGALAFDVKPYCRSVMGIDIEKENIARARKRYSRSGITYINGDATQYKYQNKFHAVILSNVLEHIEHRVSFLRSIVAAQDSQYPPVLLLRVPMITRDWISMYKKEQGVEWRLDRSHFTEYTLAQVFEEVHQAGLFVESYDIQFGEFYGVVKKCGA